MICFRADANSEVGSGHVMRCLTLAQAFHERGKECIFISADHGLDKLAYSYGFKVIYLNSKWNELDNEIDMIDNIINQYNIEIFFVDHYSITKNYLEHINCLCNLIYIDDLNAFTYPVSGIVNYNIFAETMNYREQYKGLPVRLFLGTKYIPLRREFRQITKSQIKQNCKDILISTGGADSKNFSIEIMRLVEDNKEWSNINFHFLIGKLNTRQDELINMSKKTANIQIHTDVERMDKLMMQCDIAVSAAGSTLYELCACGIPTITYVIADNQLLAAKEFERQGLMINIGDFRFSNSFLVDLRHAINCLILDENMRLKMKNLMKKIVDGNGARRLSDELLKIFI